MSKINPVSVIVAVWFVTCLGLALSSPAQVPQSDAPRVINITGDIKSDMALTIVNKLKLLDKENNKEILINITSYGGEVYAALQIVDEMKAVKSPVHTVCEGYCMSAAAMILSSGTKGLRESMPSATIMVHQVSSHIEGNETELVRELDETKRLNDLMIAQFEENTGMSYEHIEAIISYDHFMSPGQAVSYGFIDNIKRKI